EAGLARVLGRWDLTAVGVNQVIGSGIFVLPASVAALVGAASSPWPFVLAAVANLLIVLCFAEVATRFR
ncbi:MAG: amino acid transporter, partial [Gemmatimonadetes bacterium]|nr:amino acid transporter [Gemmatimonadota bacterium]NIT67896.1 amino acid transporter [Gemmatimonadota bacterium]NIY36473.1 amino acid transporter [Gemmatimonadota bacterium]